MLRWGARVAFLLIAVLITLGAYHFLPQFLFGGSSPPQSARATKAEESVTYVDINMKERPAQPAPRPAPAP